MASGGQTIVAHQKAFVFGAEDLYALLVHYTDGEVPLHGEVKEVGVSPMLGRMIGICVASDEWETDEPLHIRYDCRRIATWVKGDGEMEWGQREETPRLQTN
jgi:hypothetical protein